MDAIDVVALEGRLAADNPWWRAGIDASPVHYHQIRTALPKILDRAELGLPTLITGPRQCGKTAILLQVAEHNMNGGLPGKAVLYLRADGLMNEEAYFAETIAAYLDKLGSADGFRPLILIDDIHCLPDWESLLEEMSQRHATARVLATSAAPPIMAPPSFGRIHLPAVTFFEFMQFRAQHSAPQIGFDTENNVFVITDMDKVNAAFVDYLNMGGMPETAFSGRNTLKAVFDGRQTYLDGVLRQHLPSLFGINNPQELQSVYQILVRHSGQEISIERLAELGGAAKNTIRKYLVYLTATYQLNRLDKYDLHKGPFSRARNFKLHMAEPCAGAALFGPVEGGPESIHAVEAALLAAALLQPTDSDLYYAQWRNREIPFVGLSGDSKQKKPAFFFLDWTASEGDVLADYSHYARLPEDALGPEPYVEVFTHGLAGHLMVENVELRFTPAALYCWEMGRQAALDWPVF
jgi:predicted AAA+ superfamily ATPase